MTEHEVVTQEIERITDRYLAEIGEYVDAVQVLLSYPQPGGELTHSFATGRGNFYARVGLARDFLIRDRARMEGEERAP